MYGHNLVAVYESLEAAEQVRNRLVADGFAANSIWIAATNASSVAEVEQGTSDRTTTAEAQRETRETESGGIFSWLMGDTPERDRERYGYHLDRNRAVVSLHAADQERHDRALAIMASYNPLDLEDEGTGTPARDGIAGSGAAREGIGPIAARREGTGPMIAAADRPIGQEHLRGEHGEVRQGEVDRQGQEEQRLTAVSENVDIGKQEREHRVRVRSYVVEKPIEERLNLREERVTIERRPLASPGATAAMPQERTIEVTERREEPVINKTATAEEVIVHKETETRPETVHAVQRETKVEVEKDGEAEDSTRTPGTATPGTPNRGTPPRR